MPSRLFDDLFNAAMAAQNKGDAEEADRLFEQSARVNPLIWCQLGSVAFQQRDDKEALDAFLRAERHLKAIDDLGRTWNNIGAVLVCHGIYEGVEGILRRALAVWPNNANIWSNLAVCQFRKRDVPMATASALRALELCPNQAAAEFTLAMIYLLTGDLVRGFELYEARHRMFRLL